MAATMKISTEFATRQDKSVFWVDPRDIVVVKANNPRKDAVTKEGRKALLEDIKANGQLVPVECVKDATGKLVLASGYTRHDVVSEINADDPERLILVRVLSGVNEEEAFLINLRDNVIRNEWSTLDKANAAKILRDKYGFDDTKIAQTFHCSTVHVANSFWGLLAAPEPLRKAVAKNEITAADAIEISKSGITPDEARTLADRVRAAKQANGQAGQRARHAEVMSAAREVKAESAEAKAKANGDDPAAARAAASAPAVKRTAKQLVRLLEGREHKSMPLSTLLIRYFRGDLADKTIEARILAKLDEYEIEQAETASGDEEAA